MKHLNLFLIAAILFCGNLVTRAQDNDSVTLYFSAEEMPDLIKCLPPPPDTLGTPRCRVELRLALRRV